MQTKTKYNNISSVSCTAGLRRLKRKKKKNKNGKKRILDDDKDKVTA